MEIKVLVPVAEGFEEVEAFSIVDVFRRAGARVDVASIGELQVTSSHDVRIIADKLITDCIDEEYDLIALPGGIPGAENLRNSDVLIEILKKQNRENKLYGAVCAAPAVVLEHHGLLEGKKATCHPLFADKLSDDGHVTTSVVYDQNCVTSRGAGTSIEFALEMLGILLGEEKKQEVARGMVAG